MKQAFLFLLVATLSWTTVAQKLVKSINKEIQLTEFKSHLYFLASDEMRGRNTATQENLIAARYIAERFREYGVKMAPGMDSYMQQVSLSKEVSPQYAELTVGDRTFGNDEMVWYTAGNGTFEGELVYANYGLDDDLNGLDLAGKIVIVKAGNGDPQARLTPYTVQKQKAVMEAGGVGLIELYKPTRYPWKLMQYYFMGEKFRLARADEKEKPSFPSGWLLDQDSLLSFFQENQGAKASLTIKGKSNDVIQIPNVLGVIEGTDPALKDEYIMISAHFDHVGVRGTEGDTIWNGARDNGIGVANMLMSAKYLAKYPPKRSIAFLACNAEEKGLLGSRWYADHPVIPLEKTVYNLNTDTGGYNDVTKVTVVGFFRTSLTSIYTESAEAFGMTAIDDPLPEENFYDRSDQVSFAAKGIPAVSYDPGYISMNEQITDYYHQPGDEPQTLDYEYLTKYSKSFIYAATLIGNTDEDIFWTSGDKYEEAGKQLYKK
ncbi:MAG: M28 family peptidase [Cyclobacteriaceae bacterium]